MSEMGRQSGEKKALTLEKRRKENEARKKKFEEQIEMRYGGIQNVMDGVAGGAGVYR